MTIMKLSLAKHLRSNWNFDDMRTSKDEEKDAIAVHAIRTSPGGTAGTGAGPSGGGYAQIPDNKSFSNVNGAELMMTPSYASVSADREGQTCVVLDADGNATITGRNVAICSGKNLALGEPAEEDGQPSKGVTLEAGTIILQTGEEGSQISLTEEARIVAAFIGLNASDTSPAGNPTLEDLFAAVTDQDETNWNKNNEDVEKEGITTRPATI